VFALCLKLVEEVEEVECEDSAGAGQGCWEPTGSKKLTITRNRFYSRVTTDTVCNSYCVDSRNIKHCECYRARWERAGVINIVVELMQHA